MKLVRVAAAACVLTLGGLLVWNLTHQHNGAARAILQGKVVRAPAFRLPRLTGGGTVSLAAYRGKAVVLNFWGSYCGPCKQEMPHLEAAYKRWGRRGVVVVGMDVVDSRRAARAFARSHGVTYPIAFDPVGDTTGPYGVLATPTTFFIDRRGLIVKRILAAVSDAVLDAQIARALAS